MEFTLIDGRTILASEVTFNAAIHHFYWRGEDITSQLKRADKLTFPDFDTETENDRLYVEKYLREHGTLPPEVGSTSVWWQFKEQLLTDPLDAPLDALDTAVKKVWASTGGRTMVLVGAALVLVVLVVVLKR